ncbi:MAG: hypothetical protein R6V30_06100 [Paracoccaceae bacterium]
MMPVRDRTGISGLKGIGVAALIIVLAGCADREQRMFFDFELQFFGALAYLQENIFCM